MPFKLFNLHDKILSWVEMNYLKIIYFKHVIDLFIKF